MKKFKNKYRIESHRRPNWDYSSNGLYFLTIFTQHRECNLGEIVNGKMILSDFGKIVENEWFKSFEIRSELLLDEFIIMPNHIHAIVEIKSDDSVEKSVSIPVETNGRSFLPIETESKPKNQKIKLNQDLPIRLPKSISSFIAGFKSAVNSKIDDYIDENQLSILKYNRNNHFFQPNYHDHIIRNHFAYQRIKNYIINNPMKWDKERNNKSV
ncbi:MAG: transposase [Crocinitomicaceae bacterium]